MYHTYISKSKVTVRKIPFFDENTRISYFFQVLQENRSRTGNSSRRPAIISKVITIFDNPEKAPKLEAGPTTPRPGPMLFRVAATAVKLVIRSKLSREMISTDPTKINR